MKYAVTIPYGDEVLFSTGLSRVEFDAEAAFLLAAKLYELGRLSSGQAAKMCGRSRVDFLLALPRIGVSPANLRPDDADDEVRFLERA